VVAVVAVVVVLVGAVAFWRWPRPERPTRPRSAQQVVVIGDSVTYASSPAIYERLEEWGEVTITPRPFYRAVDLVLPFREVIDARLAAGQPLDRVVVLAGYNDVIRDDRDPSGLPQMLGLAERFDCAVWLTLPARPGGETAPADAELPSGEAEAWNERVREEAADRPAVHVSDEWQRVVEAEGGDALLQEDGVHPVRAGHLALADAMARSLVSECDG
jgi:hypothetical protein